MQGSTVGIVENQHEKFRVCSKSPTYSSLTMNLLHPHHLSRQIIPLILESYLTWYQCSSSCHKCLPCLHGRFSLSYAVHVTRSITIHLLAQIKNLSLCVRPVKCALPLCCSLTLLLKFPKESDLLLHQVKCH